MSLHRSQAEADARVVTVVRSMNAHGAMSLESEEDGAQYHVVEYRSRRLRETLESLPRGATVPVALTPVGSRGDAWRAVEIGER
jgi:hypothetical protein